MEYKNKLMKSILAATKNCNQTIKILQFCFRDLMRQE